MTTQLPLAPHEDGCVLSVIATPKAAKDLIGDIEQDAAGRVWLRVRVTAAPEDGKATKAILRLLAKSWKLAPSSFTVLSGETSRQKRLLIAAPYKEILAWLTLKSPY